MGYAVPAAIASSLQEPDRPVIAIIGDGGMYMALPELATAVENNCNITIIVINDASLALIDVKQQNQQMKSRGVRYPETDFTTAATGLGCKAWRVVSENELERTLSAALTHSGPSVVDVICDASVYQDQLAALRGG